MSKSRLRECVLLCMLVLLALSACVVLPPIGSQVGQEELGALRIGVTTRQQVIELIGEPTILDSPRFVLTDVQKEKANIFLLIGGPYGGAILGGPIHAQDSRVLFEFTEDGLLQNLTAFAWNPRSALQNLHVTGEYDRVLADPRPGYFIDTHPKGAALSSPGLLKTLQDKIHKAGGLLYFGKTVTSYRTFSSVAVRPGTSELAVGSDSFGALLSNLPGSTSHDLVKGDPANNAISYYPVGRRRTGMPVAFSPDGCLLVTGGERPEVWNVSNRKPIATFYGHGDLSSWAWGDWPIVTVAFHPEGELVATAGKQKIRLWDPIYAKETMNLVHPGDWRYVGSMAFSPDGRLLAASNDEGVHVWDVAGGRHLRALPVSQERLFLPPPIAFSPKGNQLVAAAPTHLLFWELSTQGGNTRFRLSKVLLPPLVTHSLELPTNIQYSPDGSYLLVSAAASTVIRLSDYAFTRPFARLSRAGAFMQDGDSLVTVGGDGIQFWDIRQTIGSREQIPTGTTSNSLQASKRDFSTTSCGSAWRSNNPD